MKPARTHGAAIVWPSRRAPACMRWERTRQRAIGRLSILAILAHRPRRGHSGDDPPFASSGRMAPCPLNPLVFRHCSHRCDFFHADGLPGPRLAPTESVEAVKLSVATDPRGLGAAGVGVEQGRAVGGSSVAQLRCARSWASKASGGLNAAGHGARYPCPKSRYSPSILLVPASSTSAIRQTSLALTHARSEADPEVLPRPRGPPLPAPRCSGTRHPAARRTRTFGIGRAIP